MVESVRWDSVLVGFDANHVVPDVLVILFVFVVVLSGGSQFSMLKRPISSFKFQMLAMGSDLEFDFNLLPLELWIRMSLQLAKEIQSMMRAPLSALGRLNGVGDERCVVSPNFLVEGCELFGERRDGPFRYRNRLSLGSLHWFRLAVAISRRRCGHWGRHVASWTGARCDARVLWHDRRMFNDAICHRHGRAIRKRYRRPSAGVDVRCDVGSRSRRSRSAGSG